MKWIGILILVGALGIVGTLGRIRNDKFFPNYPHEILQIGSHSLDVAIADTQPRREQGLSGVKELRSGQGLLFKFDTPGRYAFWMKNMLFPIDMVFIDSQMKVVEVIPTISPDTYPQAFSSKKRDYLYVLELGAGEVKKLHIYEHSIILQ